jgi:thiol-disulfide isomerase/thioredoxin
MKHYCIALIASVFFLHTIKAQTSSIRPLQIGDTVPDISLGKMLNYKKTEARLSDFRGRYLILDFWDTHCGTCIAQFPRMEALQEKFKDSISIIPVCFDVNREEMAVEEFIRKRKGTPSEMKLPTAVQPLRNSEFTAWFPFMSLPHEIWIDKNGVIRAITGHKYVYEDNIRAFFSGEPIVLTQKKMRRIIDENDEFLIKKELTGSNIIYGSAFAGYNDSIKTPHFNFANKRDDSPLIHFFCSNNTVFQLYSQAYWPVLKDALLDPNRKRFKIESANIEKFYKDIKDIGKLYGEAYDTYQKKNLFCYELKLPREKFTVNEALNFMANDLDHFFNIKSKVEKRKVQYVVLTKGQGEIYCTTDNSNKKSISVNNEMVWKGYPMKFFLEEIDNFKKYLISNETGYEGNVNVKIVAKWGTSNDEEIIQQLKAAGFNITIKEKLTPVLVLYDLRK